MLIRLNSGLENCCNLTYCIVPSCNSSSPHCFSSADISITLRNRGDDAFRANVYGDSIVVQQHISVDGSRSYKLKSEKGLLVSLFLIKY